jgi:hypothetical protein
MRKLVILVSIIAAALAAMAGTARADVSNPQVNVVDYGPTKQITCITPYAQGVVGQFGAWGDYIDGCLVIISCPLSSPGCDAYEQTSINEVNPSYRSRVTQNARIRIYNKSGGIARFRDNSCSGTSSCSNSRHLTLTNKQMASVQCNGVREHQLFYDPAYNSCSILMKFNN